MREDFVARTTGDVLAANAREDAEHATGMDRLASGHDAANATLLRKVFERAEIGSVEEGAHSSIEDRAARYVAELFEHDKDDVCGMHDTDKIGKRAIGDLTRKKNGRIIDPFPAGQELIKKVHNQV